jgi:transposase
MEKSITSLICLLSRPLASIWSSTFFKFMALTLRVALWSPRRSDATSCWSSSLPPCLVGLEASGSAHHWARKLIKLGHDARMMPPAYVKPYIRRQKNDASDAAAICEAVTRPSMRFVGVRSLEHQAALIRHKAREMLVCQRTELLNALRGHLTEVGVIAAQGPGHARELADRGLRRNNPV